MDFSTRFPYRIGNEIFNVIADNHHVKIGKDDLLLVLVWFLKNADLEPLVLLEETVPDDDEGLYAKYRERGKWHALAEPVINNLHNILVRATGV